MTIFTRRSLLCGLFAAPAIVAAGSLMPIRGIVMKPELWPVDLLKHGRPFWTFRLSHSNTGDPLPFEESLERLFRVVGDPCSKLGIE